MVGNVMKKDMLLKTKIFNAWFEELSIPVAPACNLMCNFCSKGSDCLCNGNNPNYLSKTMTPRQAVAWARGSAEKNRRIKVLKLTGPGEPLYNLQTFEVLRRLNDEMPDYIYEVGTNGLLLPDKMKELVKFKVQTVDVAFSAVSQETIGKMYSRLMYNDSIVTGVGEITGMLVKNQLQGIKQSLANGMEVKINTVYFPGVNDEEIHQIAFMCRELGVRRMSLISGCPSGKFYRMRAPSLIEMVNLQQELSRNDMEIEIKSFCVEHY